MNAEGIHLLINKDHLLSPRRRNKKDIGGHDVCVYNSQSKTRSSRKGLRKPSKDNRTIGGTNKGTDTMNCFMAASHHKKNPQDMETWGSDAIPIVIDSATTKTITPRYNNLMDPQPHKSRLQGVGTGSVLF